MENIEDNIIDANVLNQMPDFDTSGIGMPGMERPDAGEKKSCKSCGSGSKGIGRNNSTILVFGFAVLFTSFYGIVKIVQDVYHLFAR